MTTLKLENIKNITKEINSAVADNVEIILEKGVYHIYPEDATKRTFKITNSMSEGKCKEAGASYEKNLGIIIEGKKNVVINGNGSKIIAHCKLIPFFVFESDNITFKDFSFDYATPTTAEMEVIDKGKGYYIFKVHPDFKYRIDNDGKLTWYGDGFEFYPVKHFCQRYIPGDERVISQEEGPMMDDTARYEEIEKNILKCTYVNWRRNPYFLKNGQHLHQRDGLRDHCGSFFGWSSNVTFENMNMHYMHGLGIVAQCSENITLRQVRCAPEQGSGRVLSCFADSVQISSCRGKFIAENCLFDGTNDDAINVHGSYLKIVESADNTIVARHPHPETYNFNVFKTGDIIETTDPDYMLPEDTAAVVSAELINPYDIRIVLDKPADKFKVGFVIENVSASPDVYIKGCTVKRVPTRGFLVSSRGKVVIENNEFYSLRRSAVLLANDAKNWWETGPTNDVTIRNNRIYNQDYNRRKRAIFRIHPENTKFRKGEYVHKNIVIEDNIALGKKRVSWLQAKNAERIVFKNNKSSFIPLRQKIQKCGKIVKK